jgi:hypothetical protein
VSNEIFLKVAPDDDEFEAAVCLLEKLKDKDDRSLLHVVFSLNFYLICIGSISCFFLLLNLIAFFLSPDLKNLHGRSVAYFSGSLLVNYLLMLFEDVAKLTRMRITKDICIVISILYSDVIKFL